MHGGMKAIFEDKGDITVNSGGREPGTEPDMDVLRDVVRLRMFMLCSFVVHTAIASFQKVVLKTDGCSGPLHNSNSALAVN
jgi:hypothetical protein